MPLATDHVAADLAKVLLIGNSGAGKTGALASLVAAGYELRIIDFDSGLRALFSHVKEIDPKLLSTIEYQSFRDKVKMGPAGPKVVGSPKAYVNALQALERWPDDDSDPAEWGAKRVLVLDSLTELSRAAMQWAKATSPTVRDPRQWYKTAQDLIEDLIANVTSDAFRTNVVVISHIELVETQAGTKGYVSAIGKALGPKLPRFFDTLLVSEPSGFGTKVKRKIKTLPTAMVDAKNPAPMNIEAEYPVESAMAEIFAKLTDVT